MLAAAEEVFIKVVELLDLVVLVAEEQVEHQVAREIMVFKQLKILVEVVVVLLVPHLILIIMRYMAEMVDPVSSLSLTHHNKYK
jgi:hypothetical protein